MSSLFVGTACGLYRVDVSASGRSADLLGFEEADHGALRAPVVRCTDGRLFVGTTGTGVWWSDENGSRWRRAGATGVHDEIWALAWDECRGVLYAGTAPVALFRSTDGGRSFLESAALAGVEAADEFHLHVPPYRPRIRSIDLASQGLRVLLAIEEGFLARSDDGGGTWRTLRDGITIDCHMAIFLPGEPDVVLAATEAGVVRSRDGGRTFERCVDVTHAYATALIADPERVGRVFAVAAMRHPGYWRAGEIGAATAVYRSDDAGCSWMRCGRNLPDDLHAGPRGAVLGPSEASLFVGLSDGQVLYSEDGGESFDVFLEGLPSVTSLAHLEDARVAIVNGGVS